MLLPQSFFLLFLAQFFKETSKNFLKKNTVKNSNNSDCNFSQNLTSNCSVLELLPPPYSESYAGNSCKTARDREVTDFVFLPCPVRNTLCRKALCHPGNHLHVPFYKHADPTVPCMFRKTTTGLERFSSQDFWLLPKSVSLNLNQQD